LPVKSIRCTRAHTQWQRQRGNRARVKRRGGQLGIETKRKKKRRERGRGGQDLLGRGTEEHIEDNLEQEQRVLAEEGDPNPLHRGHFGKVEKQPYENDNNHDYYENNNK